MALAVVLALAATLLTIVPIWEVTPAQAAPGQPGVPSEPVEIYSEDFQNVPGPDPVLRLTEYVGAEGETYTADQPWLEDCNGWVASPDQSLNPGVPIADCAGSQVSWNNTQRLVYGLGEFSGAGGPGNYAVSAFTSGNPGANAVEFATVENIPFSGTGRFVAFSVDVAAVNCPPIASAPTLQFFLVDATGSEIPAGGAVNACESGTLVAVPPIGVAGTQPVRVGTYTSAGAVFVTGASIGVVMRNTNGSGGGNDHAFDNLRVLDVTPQLDKAFVPAEAPVGEIVDIVFTVTNTTELNAKEGWSFTDELPEGFTVAGAATTTCTEGVVNAAAGGGTVAASGNLDQGQASCTFTVPAVAGGVGEYTNDPAAVDGTGLNPPNPATHTAVERAPAVSIEKSATVSPAENQEAVELGDEITYTFEVTNTGNVPLFEITVNDPTAGAVSCPVIEEPGLAVGDSVTCEADDVYPVTQEDVDAGSVDNSATATGVDRLLNTSPVSEPSVTEVPAAQMPEVTLTKSADPLAEPVAAGDEVTYSFVVANTGNLTLTDFELTETAFTGTGRTPEIVCDDVPASLAPTEDFTCSATYALTQQDVDAGMVDNTATVTALAANGADVTDSDDAPVPAPAAPELTLTKTATPDEAEMAGEEIVYSFLVENTGNVTVTDLVIDEGAFTGTGELSEIICLSSSLAAGASTLCSASYTLTQADVDAGTVENTATATGTTPGDGGPVTSDPSSEEVIIEAAPALEVVKTATPDAVTVAGTEISYSFVVSNTGNVTLTDVVLAEGDFSGSGELSEVVCPDGAGDSLAPGADFTCTATYLLTQADVDAGAVVNTAGASGSDPSGDPVDSPTATEVVEVEHDPALTLVKSADPADEASFVVGAEVTYSFLVTNTGNVTITDVVVLEGEFTGTGELSDVVCPEGAASLEPEADVLCTATYTVTQDDVDAGGVENTATATGTPPGDADPIESPSSTVQLPGVLEPALTIEKGALLDDANRDELGNAGEEIRFVFVVTNIGNVTISDVEVQDPMIGDVTCEATTLTPGEAVDCLADEIYTVTPEDEENGAVVNTATATGTSPGGGDPIESDPSTVEIDAAAIAVTPGRPSLPTTGISALGTGLAMLLILGGAGVLTIRHRPRRLGA